MRAQGPNAQCKDYYDLSSAQQLMTILLSHVETPLLQLSLSSLAGIQTRDPYHDVKLTLKTARLCTRLLLLTSM